MVSFPLFDYSYYSIELLLMAKASGMSVYITSCTWTHFIFKSLSPSQTFVIRDLFAHMPGSHNTPIGPLLNSTLAAMSLKHPNQPKQFIEPSFRGRGASFVALAIHYIVTTTLGDRIAPSFASSKRRWTTVHHCGHEVQTRLPNQHMHKIVVTVKRKIRMIGSHRPQ